MTRAYLQRIGTAVPDHDIHEPFVAFAAELLTDPRARKIFQRLATKSDIHHRYSCLHAEKSLVGAPTDAFAFYGSGTFHRRQSECSFLSNAPPSWCARPWTGFHSLAKSVAGSAMFWSPAAPAFTRPDSISKLLTISDFRARRSEQWSGSWVAMRQ